MASYAHDPACITLTMSSDTLPSPQVASASSEFDGNHLAFNAFNQVGGGKWAATNNVGAWLKVDLGSGNARGITGYTIAARNDGYYNQAPTGWTIAGSNDNSAWTTLHTVSGQSAWAQNEMRAFTLSAKTDAFRYYRLTYDATAGANAALQQWELLDTTFGADVAAVYPSSFDTDWVKASSTNSSPYPGHAALNPARSLIGVSNDNEWLTADGYRYGRLHVRLPSATRVTRLLLHNRHHSGGYTNLGAKDFTFWGTDSSSAFADTTFGTDTGWTRLPTWPTQLREHPGTDTADPQFVSVLTPKTFTYFCLKVLTAISTSYNFTGIRRLTLYSEPAAVAAAAALPPLPMRGRARMR